MYLHIFACMCIQIDLARKLMCFQLVICNYEYLLMRNMYAHLSNYPISNLQICDSQFQQQQFT